MLVGCIMCGCMNFCLSVCIRFTHGLRRLLGPPWLDPDPRRPLSPVVSVTVVMKTGFAPNNSGDAGPAEWPICAPVSLRPEPMLASQAAIRDVLSAQRNKSLPCSQRHRCSRCRRCRGLPLKLFETSCFSLSACRARPRRGRPEKRGTSGRLLGLQSYPSDGSRKSAQEGPPGLSGGTTPLFLSTACRVTTERADWEELQNYTKRAPPADGAFEENSLSPSLRDEGLLLAAKVARPRVEGGTYRFFGRKRRQA